jgi:hypothetical protein
MIVWRISTFAFVGVETDCRTTWGRKNLSTGNASGGLVNRAVTPQTANQRTNSPTPAGNAWTMKADERASHDQFTHLLYTLTVPPSLFPMGYNLVCFMNGTNGRANRYYCIHEGETLSLAY